MADYNPEELGEETAKEMLGREYTIERVEQKIRLVCADNFPFFTQYEFSKEEQEKAVDKCTETFIHGLSKMKEKGW